MTGVKYNEDDEPSPEKDYRLLRCQKDLPLNSMPAIRIANLASGIKSLLIYVKKLIDTIILSIMQKKQPVFPLLHINFRVFNSVLCYRKVIGQYCTLFHHHYSIFHCIKCIVSIR